MLIALLVLPLAAASQPLSQPNVSNGRIAVSVTSAAQERMARDLASAVLKEVKRDSRFALIDHPSPALLNIALPAGIGWERRLDWTEIFFRARLNSASERSQVIAGRCYNWNMSVCARQILDAAARFGAV
jgi:hypothetical protein